MFNFTIDLFEALNITIKNISWIDLDDFLYLFDNFTFYFNHNLHRNKAGFYSGHSLVPRTCFPHFSQSCNGWINQP